MHDRFTLHPMTQPIVQSPQDSTEQLASFCKAAGDSLRLNILRVLRDNSFGVLELAHIFATGQSGISHHLKVLTQAGLVVARREGNAIFYRRNLHHAQQPRLLDTLLDSLDAQPIATSIAGRVSEVHLERANTSAAFFQRIGQEFSQNQELIASLAQYSDNLTGLIDSLPFCGNTLAVEIGPGNGNFLPALSQRFSQVLAVDNSPHMLQQAQQHCRKLGLGNVAFRQADALSTVLPQSNCIILNMVLHHLAAPATAIQQLAQALKPGGSLIISELCQHDQVWAHQTCGDLWLGFAQEELARWASLAGLTPRESIYLGLKNGFQIQLRHFARPDPEAITLIQESK